ncbi:hypothetical protein ABZ912_29825 [Nonomuraea angiospora]|uniref:hypothetical protein n=1 Tax=Nonomuraea angiospora TaxID=46172 RepID=UPI00340EB8D9
MHKTQQQLREEAAAAIVATLSASETWHGHRAACRKCANNLECTTSYELQVSVNRASRASDDALMAFMPPNSYVEYHGPHVHQHGTWWVASTCRKSLYTTFLLRRPNAEIIDNVPLADVRKAFEPEPRGMLAAVRESAAEISALLATCGYVLATHVDYDEHKRVTVMYDAPVFANIEREARFARRNATGQAAEDAAYIVAALASLKNMTNLARAGALARIDQTRDTAKRTRERVAARTTARPRT